MPVSNGCFLSKVGEYHTKNNSNANKAKINKRRSSRYIQGKNINHKIKGTIALMVLVSLIVNVSQAHADFSVRMANPHPHNVRDVTGHAGGFDNAKGAAFGILVEKDRYVPFANKMRRVDNIKRHHPSYDKSQIIRSTESFSKKSEVVEEPFENKYFEKYAIQKWKITETIKSLKQRYIENFPDIINFAALQMKQAIFNKTGLRLDPDKIYFHHFTSAQNDPTAITGWRHDLSKPVESWTVTECLLKNFPADARDNMDVVDQMTGIYRVPADGADSFGGENQVAIKPSTVAGIVIELDFFDSYINKLARYWKTRFQDMMNLYVFLQGLVSVNDDVKMHDFYLKAFSIINDSHREVKKYLFDINGYLSTDMIILTPSDSSFLAVYMPRSDQKLLKFKGADEIRAWFASACADVNRRDEMAGYFSLKDRQDGLFYIGVDSWLTLLADVHNHDDELEKIGLSQHEVTDTLIEFLSARQQSRAMEDADCLIKSNAEVRLDMALRYFSVVDMVLPNPITPFVSLGLGIEKMLNADTETDRRTGAKVVIGESINIALMAFCSVIESRLPMYSENDLSSLHQPLAGDSLTSVSTGMRQEYLSISNNPKFFNSVQTQASKFFLKTPTADRTVMRNANMNPLELVRIENKQISQSRISQQRLLYVDNRGIYADEQGYLVILLKDKIYRLTSTDNAQLFFVGEQLEQGIIFSRKTKNWKMVDYQRKKSSGLSSLCRARRDVLSSGQYCLRFSERVKNSLDKNMHFGLNFKEFSQRLIFDVARNVYVDKTDKMEYLLYGDKLFLMKEEPNGYAIYGISPPHGEQKIMHVIPNKGKHIHYLSTRIEQLWETLKVAKMSLKPLTMKSRHALNIDEINAIEELKRTSSYPVNQYLLKGDPAGYESGAMKIKLAEQIKNVRSALTKLGAHKCTARKLGIITESDFQKLKTNDIFENAGFAIASTKQITAYKIKLINEKNIREVEYEFHLVNNGYPISHQASRWYDTEILIPDGCFFNIIKVNDHTIVLAERESPAIFPIDAVVRKLNFGTPDLAPYRLEREKIMMFDFLKSDINKAKYSSVYMEKYTPMLKELALHQIGLPAIEAYSEAGSDFVNRWLRFGIDSVNEMSVKASAEARAMLLEYSNLKDFTHPVYRAVYCPPGVYGGLIKEGDVIMDQGFMSASALPLNSLEWKTGWSKGVSHPRDVPVIFIIDSQVGKKIASTHLLLDHIIIRPRTPCKVESISSVLDAKGQQVSVVCLSQGEDGEGVKDIYSGAMVPNREII